MADDEKTGPGAGVWLSGGFIAVLAVVGVVVSIAVARDDDPAPTAQPTTVSATAAPSTSNGPGEGCGFTVDDVAVPAVAPPAAWQLLRNGIAVPSLPEAGPRQETSGGLLRCYAQSPTGALFAAANFLGQVADPVTVGDVVAQLCAPGAGRDVLVQLADTNPEVITGSGEGYQIAGFVFVSTSDTTVALQVALAAQGGFVAVPLTLTWDGDWQVQVPVDGNFTAGAQPIDSLAGFIPWSGAR